MKGLYVFSTKQLLKGTPLMSFFDSLILSLSLKMWQRHNGKTLLYTDKQGVRFFEEKGMLSLFDNVNDTFLPNNMPEDVDYIKYYTYAKPLALTQIQGEVCLIDLDLYVNMPVTDILQKHKMVGFHREVLSLEAYDPFLTQLSDSIHNQNQLFATNVALLYFADEKTKKSYTDLFFEFENRERQTNKYYSFSVSPACVAEQYQAAALIEKYKGTHLLKEIYTPETNWINTHGLFNQKDNNGLFSIGDIAGQIWHTWGGKALLKQHTDKSKEYIIHFMKFAQKHYPVVYKKAQTWK